MSDYKPTIGLEIHAELKTKTKMFCQSANQPHESTPNVHICPICMAFPGTLPVVNKKAVEHVLRVGAAVEGKLADYTEFDRKNYFYPDLPKGYQISQYKYPLVSGGTLAGVELTRIHLEEDTARSQHTGGDYTLIDFNRAGVPLMELVTEPVVHDAETASRFAQELQLLLRTLGVSDANMEKGEMRVEANISVSRDDTFGTKVEVKNLNSFKSVEKAIEYEIKRHVALLEKGGKIVQETRGWDENKQETFSQRAKEDSHDYRYFPDPDIPKFRLSQVPEFSKQNIASSLPELPWDRRDRYTSLGIKPADAVILTENVVYAMFLDEEILSKSSDLNFIKTAVNYLLTDIRASEHADIEKLKGGVYFELIELVTGGSLSSRGAKEVLTLILKEGGSPKALAEREGLIQVHDVGALKAIAEKVVASHESVLADLKEGKEAALQFLIGQGMKESKGSANPQELAKLFKEIAGV